MLYKIRFLFLGIIFVFNFLEINAALLTRNLSYDKYTLKDNYTYKNIQREFQWGKYVKILDYIDNYRFSNTTLGTLKNYKNSNGLPPLARQMNKKTDSYGVRRNQGIPLYSLDNMKIPERYALDGSLVEIFDVYKNFYIVKVVGMESEWMVPSKYMEKLKSSSFSKVIFVDRRNQNIATIEKVGLYWEIKSMNPATTGINTPPHRFVTPLGFFVVQEKKKEMLYANDQLPDLLDGFAPYATRFSGGGYIHGVPINFSKNEETGEPNIPVDLSQVKKIEYSKTLGTIARSHMCVRNATSHAKHIYNWVQKHKDLIIVIE